MKALTKKLVEAWGPPGYEHHVRAMIEEEVEGLCDEMRVDTLGNLICRVGEKTGSNKRIMIAAHMDEIGLMVSHIDRKGYLRFESLGGLFAPTLMGNRVLFENGTVGTLGFDDFWGNYSKALKNNEFYIDVSMGSDENGGNDVGDIKVGDPAVFLREFEERGSRWIAKSMDDRIGCVVAIEAMRKLKDSGKVAHEVYFVFTVQEEVGVRGATTSAFAIDPDIGIALDVTPAGDEIKTTATDTRLGKGAAVKIKDGGIVVPPEISAMMINLAEKNGIPYQREILRFGGTDAKAIHLTRSGVPSGVISVPCRYVHTVSETVDRADVEACVDLVAAIASTADLGL
ncbi:MAG: M20/M25/M40 family metallo-hydrolase [Chloroflexi bacterium]|nr:M20/M25/M40 family metallo-hydrolase [Chloroflexota bacterium]